MKRAQYVRAPSPTTSTYSSGISNYRSESYRPLRDNVPVPQSPSDPRAIARTHFEELSRYLASYLAKEPANSRSTARQKLTRLTRQQFQELSTDVYDELIRRKNNSSDNEVPFLPVRDDFHPKRNQARQKLATLPTARFKDLSSDVYYELARRYPEFKDEPVEGGQVPSPGSTYDDYPSPDFPTSPRAKNGAAGLPARPVRASADRAPENGYSSGLSRRPSERRPIEDDFGGRRSTDTYGGTDPASSSRRKPSQDIYRPDDRRRPSQDIPIRRSEDREPGANIMRRPSESVSTTSESTSASNAQSATAGMGMIIPNKSTIAEEDIEVPYGREVRDSSSTAIDDRERDRNGERSKESDVDGEGDLGRPRSPPSSSALGGLSGLTARLQAADADEDDGAARSGEDYFDKMSFGRASVASDRSTGAAGIGARMMGGRVSVGAEENEKLRRDYEFKIATMQNRIATLERDVDDANQREQRWSETEERLRSVESELEEVRGRLEERTTAMVSLQQELDAAKEDLAREKDMAARRAREDEEELQILRDRCEKLESERATGGEADQEILEQLRSDMEGLMTELSDLSRRNDELMTAKDSDLSVIRDLDSQLKEYKRKYEQAKTELRSVKATSQLYLQAPKLDDQLPVSPEGGLLDVHVTSFVSAIDNLLTAGRSNAPTRVLTPMKAVVNSVTAILDDVRNFERRAQRDRSDVDLDAVRALRDRAEATLSNLVAASKTHATSSGMSPVSLLDAAASHVSLTVTEIGKTICIRKASRSEREQEQTSVLPSGSTASNSYIPSLQSVEEVRPAAHQRGFSSSSSRRGGDSYSSGARSTEPPSSSTRTATTATTRGRPSLDERRPLSNGSSSDTSSPPPIFDDTPAHNAGGMNSDESAAAEGSEDAWAELKPYLEAQTESIVYAIQSVLSGVRSPTPSPTLNENLTQIITIVSSIVAVCKDNLPPGTARQGEDILAELGEHANRLSEVQAMTEVTKESRQIMAKSSFAVANAMKGLMKL